MMTTILQYWALVLPVFGTAFVLWRVARKAQEAAAPAPVPVRVSERDS